MDDEFWNNLLQHTMDLYVDPEVTRRLDDGRIDRSWRLYAAQVIMNVGEPVQVRLNDEVSGMFKATLPDARPEDVGKQVSLSDFEEIRDMHLTLDDPNAGHITALLHRGTWWLTFDLRYNRARILEYLSVVDDFLETANDARGHSKLRPFVECLLTAVEHLARCYLLFHPDESLLKKNSSHSLVQTRFNQWSQFGNVDRDYVTLLNRLFVLRSPARYMTSVFWLSPWEADELSATALRLRNEVEARLPPRSTRRWSG